MPPSMHCDICRRFAPTIVRCNNCNRRIGPCCRVGMDNSLYHCEECYESMKGKHGMNTNPMRQNATLATKLRMPVAISWIDALLDAAEDAVERAEYTNSGQALDLAIGRLRHVDDSIRGGLNAHLPVETLARFDHLLARVEDEVFRHKAMHTNPCK